MKLYSHVVTYDTGLAPNPFHGYCTTALCTPSHKRAKLTNGDWLIGNSQKSDRNQLVYAMRISQKLSMNQYFNDHQYDAKKPKPEGSLEKQCGDNIYYQGADAVWKRVPSRFHNTCADFVKDVGTDRKGRPVFVAKHFYYFGRQRVPIPQDLEGVICRGRGVNDKSHMADQFVQWLEAKYQPGIYGKPRDIADRSREKDRMITDLCSDVSIQTPSQCRGDVRPLFDSLSKIRRSGCS